MEHHDLVYELKQLGFTDFGVVGGQCPYQIECNHSSGVGVYFRSRHQHASIEVYNTFLDLTWDSTLPDPNQIVFESSIGGFDKYHASYIDHSQALDLFTKMWMEYLKQA